MGQLDSTFEIGLSLHRREGWKPGGFKPYGSAGFSLYSPPPAVRPVSPAPRVEREPALLQLVGGLGVAVGTS
jgi:hypothetical protein